MVDGSLSGGFGLKQEYPVMLGEMLQLHSIQLLRKGVDVCVEVPVFRGTPAVGFCGSIKGKRRGAESHGKVLWA